MQLIERASREGRRLQVERALQSLGVVSQFSSRIGALPQINHLEVRRDRIEDFLETRPLPQAKTSSQGPVMFVQRRQSLPHRFGRDPFSRTEEDRLVEVVQAARVFLEKPTLDRSQGALRFSPSPGLRSGRRRSERRWSSLQRSAEVSSDPGLVETATIWSALIESPQLEVVVVNPNPFMSQDLAHTCVAPRAAAPRIPLDSTSDSSGAAASSIHFPVRRQRHRKTREVTRDHVTGRAVERLAQGCRAQLPPPEIRDQFSHRRSTPIS